MIKVCIDPGHGGKDPGAVGNGLLEKDITLDIALRLKEKLSEFNIVLTRSKDEYVPLSERAAIANEAKVALFISIHVNSAVNIEANGFEVFHHPNSINGDHLACLVHKTVLPASGLKDRGVKANGGMYVLRATNAPSVLVELGFISNEEDALLLKDGTWRNKVVEAMASGIKNYCKERGLSK